MNDFSQLKFQNKVNHFNTGTTDEEDYYGQRYWFNDQFFDTQSGPVFLYLCGEWTCSPPDTSMYPFMVGASHDALLVTLEHRYYGDSQPFDDWQTHNLRYLTSEQALADAAYFIDSMNADLVKQNGVKPEWIVIGGSYPGALSAWFKSQYPLHALGAWSSSGVVHAVYDFHDFDNSLYTSMSKSGATCPSQVVAQYTYIEEQFAQGTNIDEICTIFNIDPTQLNQKDFFWFLSDIYTTGVQYGDRTNLCAMLQGQYDQNMPMLDQLTEVAAYGKAKGLNYYQYDANSLQDTTIDINSNLRQWTYQYCTEFGFFQTPLSDTYGMRSQVLNLDFWPDYCTRIFGSRLPENQADETNKLYGGLDIKGQNIFFANAEEDPWQWAAMRELHTEQQEKSMTAAMINCTDCGHCIDFHTPTDDQPAELTAVQGQIADTVAMWLESAKKVEEFLQ